MQKLYYIPVFIVFLCAAVKLQAQNTTGVALHSDPRLAVLLKNARPPERVLTARPVAAAGVAKAVKPKPVKPLPVPDAGEVKSPAEPRIAQPKDAASAVPAVKTAVGKVHDVPPADIKMAGAVKPAVTKDRPAAKDKDTDKEKKQAKHTFLGESSGPRYTGEGFRVQIYNGPDRDKALRIKADFMSHNPGVHTYINYASPCYKVRAGDFRKRADAEGMFHEVNALYSPCMIVPDMVTIKAK